MIRIERENMFKTPLFLITGMMKMMMRNMKTRESVVCVDLLEMMMRMEDCYPTDSTSGYISTVLSGAVR